MKQQSVFETLSRSNAKLRAERRINQSLRVAFWSNDSDRVHYQKDSVHTLAFYLRGGEGSRRVDAGYRQPKQHGSSGVVCLLPQGQCSSWEISAPFQFAHLYFREQTIKRYAQRELDIDPRQVVMPELTFHRSPALNQRCLELFTTPLDDDPLSFEQASNQVFAALLDEALPAKAQFQGGLGSREKRIALDYLHSHWADKIVLGELAQQCGLSEFHFQRMFKQSLGCSPADYQLELRLSQARQLLAAGFSALQVAMECGFSSQAHFSRRFQQQLGLSPSAYQKSLRN
ncbi:helix-turn-helix domain-containing protein [Aliagarivorans marinus]|uniref:helix-turn-helix domain-containing protein n=1 Tax=Aliagarivorans marinus TaxID=561965 RepID=UPI00041FB123|nr:AraC family transcriptional regulator [Aliagarivorans marinus]